MMDRDIDIPDRQPEADREQASNQSGPASPSLSRERECIDVRGYRYQVSPSEQATLREIGRFRTINTADLRHHQYGGREDQMREELASLRSQGLAQERTVWTSGRGDKVNVVVLTKAGRELVQKKITANDHQEVYSGFVKPAEVAHDAAIYRMYQAEAARIHREGGRIRRIVLDYELKRNVYRPLAQLRSHGSPTEYAKRQAAVAAENHLKVVRGRIFLPDLRIEYETRNGLQTSVDLELATEHYRGGMMRGKADAGFKFYAPGDSAARLAAAFDPEIIPEIFSF